METPSGRSSPAIVAQINLVNNFTGNGAVKSFYVPYFCPECDEEKVLLVEATDMGPPPHEPPVCRCDECDLVMDFDDMPDSYFAFLSNQRKVAEPDKVNGAMRELGRVSDDGKSKVRSRASQPNLTGTSKPSVPSLPSIQRSGSQSSKHPSKQPSRPPLGAFHKSPSSPGNPPGSRPPSFASGGHSMPSNSLGFVAQGNMAPVAAPSRSNTLVFVLIAILLAAIGVLAYLVLTK